MNCSTDQVIGLVSVSDAPSGFVARLEDFLRTNMITPVFPAQKGRGREGMDFYKTAFVLTAIPMIEDWIREERQTEADAKAGVTTAIIATNA